MLYATKPASDHTDATSAGASAPVHTLEPTSTIDTLFANAVRDVPDAPFVSDGDHWITRAELASDVRALRRRLIAAGVSRGDVVAVQMPNRSATIAALHAIWALGAVPCAITPIYRGAELAAIIAAARPTAIFVPQWLAGADHQAMVAAALRSSGCETSILAIDLDPERGVGADSPLDAPGETNTEIDPGATDAGAARVVDDVALLMFTSGTTGRAKGVLHTHRTLIVESQSISDVFSLGADPIFMPSPLGHITGLLYGVVLPLLTEGSVVLSDRWDADAAAEAIERAGCRFTVAATPFLRGLTDAYRRRGTPSALDAFVCGGADIPANLVREARGVMSTIVCRAYGSTELPTLCVVRPDDPDDVRLGTEGRPLGGQARLTELEDDGEGEPRGDLEAKGPELFVGYLDPADNEAAFTVDGWFRTGDLARILPDGQIVITGRRKDLIVRGGENISAKEIEDLLLSHPSIDDVAVIGLPDEVMGERVCAVVIGTEMTTLKQLTAHLDTAGIARQKFPEALWLVDAFPRTASGKIQKFQLRSLALHALARGEVMLRIR